MNRSLRRTLRVAALTIALTAAAPLAATAARADLAPDVPVTTVDTNTDDAVPQTDLIDDNTTELLDLAQDAASGCVATQDLSAGPNPFNYQQVPPPAGSSSIYYREWTTGTFSVGGSCRAGVKVQVCLTDASMTPWRTYRTCRTNEGAGRDVEVTAEQDVPYLGPDAGQVRPYGDITITILGWNKRSDGRYPRTPTQCRSYHIAFEPLVTAVTLEERRDCPSVLATDVLLGSISA